MSVDTPYFPRFPLAQDASQTPDIVNRQKTGNSSVDVAAIMIDPKELADHLKADADIIRSLREHGDIESIVRPVEVCFRGEATRIAGIYRRLEELAWRITHIRSEDPDEQAWLVAERDQTTEATEIAELTRTALKLAAEFGVEFDGWGAIAQRAQ